MIMAKANPIEVQKALKGINYPANRDTVVKQARKNHADRGLVDTFEHLRRNRYDGPNDVEKEVFGS
jgi:hypothetical protein